MTNCCNQPNKIGAQSYQNCLFVAIAKKCPLRPPILADHTDERDSILAEWMIATVGWA